MAMLIRRSALLLRRPPPGGGGGTGTPLFPGSARQQAAEAIPSRLAATFLSSSAAAGAAAARRSPMIRSSMQGYHRMFSDGSSATTGTRTQVGGREPMFLTKICRGLVDWFSALEFSQKLVAVYCLCFGTLITKKACEIEAKLKKLEEGDCLHRSSA